jgi:hypothetical protein
MGHIERKEMEMGAVFWSGILKGRCHLGDLDVDGRIIVRLILECGWR